MTSQTVTIERSKLELALDAFIELLQRSENFHTADVHFKDFAVAKDAMESSCSAITAIKEALSSPNGEAQPEQKPVAYGMWDSMIGCGGRMMYVRLDKGQDGCTVPLYTRPPVPTAQPKQEKNFCQRCGKQLGKNDWDIHTCTPPQPKELEQKPVAVMELYTDGWDLVEGIDTDWLETLPFGTRLFSHPPVTTAQPEQEPASGLTPKGYFIKGWDARGMLEGLKGSVVTDAAMRRYMTEIPDTAPPQRKPLTVEQRREISKALRGRNWRLGDAIDAVEAAHGIKGEA